ncbi:MAG: glycosyltransferase family 4 protein [Nitrososphaeria archaeon]
MKILLIHSCNIPPITGGDYVYFKIYQALKKRFNVTNFSTSLFLNRFHGIPWIAVRYSINPFFELYPMFVRRAYNLIFTSWDCDLPFFGDVVYAQPPSGELARCNKGCNFSVTYGKNLLGTLVGTIGNGSTWPYRKLFGKFSIKYHRFISNSIATQKFIKHKFNKDSIVIYPPVPTHLYSYPGGKQKENLVLTIGRVVPEKRFDLIGVVGPKVPEAKFVLIGGANNRGRYIVDRIKQKFDIAGLKDNFIYLGKVSDSIKCEFLQKAKVLFHPTPYESFGIVIVEGMAAGAVPCAHNSGGPPEFVDSDNLFTNAEEAVEKIRNALNKDSSARKELRTKALKFSEKRFENELLYVINRMIST